MKKRKGISLLVLVITIIVVIILAGAVILNLSSNNPIENASQAASRSRMLANQEQLNMYLSSKFILDLGTSDFSNLNVSMQTDATLMKKIFPNLDDASLSKIDVYNGKLRYIGNDVNDLAAAKNINLNIKSKYDGTLEITNTTTNIINLNEGTIETWVNVTNNLRQELADKTIFSTYVDEKYTNTLLLRYTRDKTWQGIMSSDYNQISDISVSDNLSEGWHLFTLKWNTSEFSLYIDGSKVATKANPTLMQVISNNIHIGTGPRLNLVKNGYLNSGNNTNFTNLNYYNSLYYSSPSSFKKDSGSTILSSEYIQVDPNKLYNLSGYFKSVGTSGLNSLTYYGVDCYDDKFNQIGQYNTVHFVNTETTLAQDLKQGDTTVYLTNASNWKHTADPYHTRYIGISNYLNFTNFEYTRNSYYFLDSDQVNNTITLSNAYSGTTVKAGTKVANYYADGGSYRYCGGYNYVSTINWVNFKGNIQYNNKYNYVSDNAFRYNTKYIKILMLLNYSQNSTYSTLVDDIEFRDMTNTIFNSEIQEVCISNISRSDNDILKRYKSGILSKDINVTYLLTE